jgi:membrane-associated protein
MNAINQVIVSLAASPWVLVVVLLLIVVDGFLPVLPSESVVVALAAIGAATGLPNPWFLFVVAGVGSFLGDNIAFRIGHRVGASGLRVLRYRRVAALLSRARANLDRRPIAVIVTARFIPVGRVAVNVVAGASGFSRRRFVALSAISAIAWAAYSTLIGLIAGSWIHHNPFFGVVIAVAFALTVGLLVDRIDKLRTRPRAMPTTAVRHTTPTVISLTGSRIS